MVPCPNAYALFGDGQKMREKNERKKKEEVYFFLLLFG